MMGLLNVPGARAAASKSLPKQALHAIPTLIVGSAVVFSVATVTMVAINAYRNYAAQRQSALGPAQMDSPGAFGLAGRVVSVCTLDSTPTPFALPLADCIDQVAQLAQELSRTVAAYRGKQHCGTHQNRCCALPAGHGPALHGWMAWEQPSHWPVDPVGIVS